MEFNLETIAVLAILIGQIVAIVLAIRQPNERQEISIAEISAEVMGLKSNMVLIQQNHLPHIEGEMKSVSERLTRIETILEERLPGRKE